MRFNPKKQERKMKVFKKTLIAATLLLSMTSAQAAFVHKDWKVSGDARATLHEETGIEWLKLDNTSNRSMDEVSADAAFTGWRLPTRGEVNTLIGDMLSPLAFNSSPVAYSGSGSPLYTGYVNTWQEFMSIAQTDAQHVRSFGLHTDGSGGTLMTGARKATQGSSVNSYNIFNDLFESNYSPSYKSTKYSVFLVSDGGTTLSSQLDPSINANNANNANAPISDVSAPALLGLMGLFGFAARRRNAK
jgi:hypothetical protein